VEAMIREPVVSGQFYPSQKEELIKIIESFKPKKTPKIAAKGIILPHAGYIYSGRVAVTTIHEVLPKKRLIILGTNHTGRGTDFSLWAKGAWRTPLGQVSIDQDLAELILNKGDDIKEDYAAHMHEHSIEVELPIINYFFDEFKFVPIACKRADLETYERVSFQIVEATKKIKDEILFVASTDLTHYEPDLTARKKDRLVIESLVNLDEENLVKEVSKSNVTMCGEAPTAVLLSCLKSLGAKKSRVVLYQTSGDALGDYNSVVGYVGMVIS